jgi:hypothetical protein
MRVCLFSRFIGRISVVEAAVRSASNFGDIVDFTGYGVVSTIIIPRPWKAIATRLNTLADRHTREMKVKDVQVVSARIER